MLAANRGLRQGGDLAFFVPFVWLLATNDCKCDSICFINLDIVVLLSVLLVY